MATNLADLKQGQKPNNPIAAFSSFMDKLKPQLALALPKHLTADRMARLALTAFSTTPKLQECDPKSIAASIMTAGQLGLEPGVNGAGFLVPYGRTCTFVPGWKGLVDLVSRSGRGTVFTGVIFRDQEYTYTDGARRDLVIHNETDLDDPSDITHAYAIGWVKDAAMPIIELWRVTKIQKHRDKYNKQGNKHYSFRDWEMYARKIPLLQVLKYMPCSVEVQNAIAISDAAERGKGAVIEGNCVIVGDDISTDEKSESGVDQQQIEQKQPTTIPQQTRAQEAVHHDAETGEINDPVGGQQQGDGAPTFADAHAAVRSGDLDLARDIARSLPDQQRQQIEAAIANLSGDQQQQDASVRGRGRQRSQGGLGLE
ncbi:recombinase RecT [Azoarcus communis]|uniref:Recombinase RecT n=2 Tax=Parazoarcus communis TaxID=41977 RepID=A0A323USU7_9RHOO|nr:recombinase RecT [Parazoarcus communis SWub3 = DSM 12120]PZA16112.1 recombinase RecT [Azoarcus communis] [Parazoarcus communis SWub3 = DSM 12120]